MAAFKVLCVLLFVFTVSALASFYDELPEEREFEDDRFDERQLALELRALREKRIKAFDCKKKDEECKGVVPCCDTLQCYWKDGFSVRTSGVCVACIQQNQLCQRDTQCCAGYVCQKEKSLYVDGRCDLPRAAGQPCHEDDQCSTKNCRISWWDKLSRKEGVCG